jgi:DNA-binding NarL/FixJ family response regulator
MMPGVDGWEVLASIKAEPDPDLSRIPVVMLTARTDDVDRIRGGIEGAIRYITKPFSLAELREEVQLALEGDAEPVKRRRAQHQALEQLARLERGASEPEARAPRPKLTKLEGPGEARPQHSRPPRVSPEAYETLSDKQRELLRAVSDTPTVQAAALELAVSRSNVYASLRRIARKLGVTSVPELVALARQGGLPVTEG